MPRYRNTTRDQLSVQTSGGQYVDVGPGETKDLDVHPENAQAQGYIFAGVLSEVRADAPQQQTAEAAGPAAPVKPSAA